jgi:hypothetical protein
MEDKKTLIITVQNDDGKHTPVWKECEVSGAECPECRKLMTAIMTGGEKHFVYAHCPHCHRYFIGE